MLAITRFRRAKRKAEEGEGTEAPTLRERGAAALEFALIAPLFFLVVFGGIEIGYMFRSNLTLQDATRNAARIASVERNNPGADEAILERINVRVAELNGDVTKVVIFMGDNLGSEVPPGCSGLVGVVPPPPSNSSLRCNVYPGGVYTPGELGIPDADRQAWDNIGIYIEYDYNYVTGFFDSITLSSTTVEVIELEL